MLVIQRPKPDLLSSQTPNGHVLKSRSVKKSLHFFKIVTIYAQLLQYASNRSLFKIPIPPVRNHGTFSRSRVYPLSMRTSTPTRDFVTTEGSKPFSELFIVHDSAKIRDSNHTGDFIPSATKPAGSSFPMSS